MVNRLVNEEVSLLLPMPARSNDDSSDDSLRIYLPFLASIAIMAPVMAFPLDISLWADEFHDSLDWGSSKTSWFKITVAVSTAYVHDAQVYLDLHGPFHTLCMGCAVYLSGFGFISIGLLISGSPRWIGSCLVFVGGIALGQATIWCFMPVLKVLAFNTKPGKSTSIAIGVIEVSIALAPVICDIVIVSIWGDNITGLRNAALGCSLSAMVLLLSPLVNFLPPGTEKLDLQSASSWSWLLSACMVFFGAVMAYELTTSTLHLYMAVVCMLIFAVLVSVTSYMGIKVYMNSCFGSSNEKTDLKDRRSGSICFEYDSLGASNANSSSSSFAEAMADPRFWILFAMWGVNYGCSIGMFYSVDDVLKSGADDDGYANSDDYTYDAALALVCISTGNTAARIFVSFAGTVPAFKSLITDGDMWMVGILVLQSLALLWLSIVDWSVMNQLKVPLFLIGLTFGAPYPLVIAVELAWFGPCSISQIHSAMIRSCILGILVLYRGLFLTIYEYKRDENSGTEACACFELSFRIESGLCLATALIGYLALARGRHLLRTKELAKLQAEVC